MTSTQDVIFVTMAGANQRYQHCKLVNGSGGCLENEADSFEFRCIPIASSERARELWCCLPGVARRHCDKITEALSDDMTGSISVQEATKAEVKNFAAQHTDSQQ
jgi:hypothetical protein